MTQSTFTHNKSEIDCMVRVNHAGEYGAVRIYAGQLAALQHTQARGPDHGAQIALLSEMAAQEQRHLDYFHRLIIERQVRPTVLQPLWHIGGFALGYITGILGEKTAHACTIAVEEVIEEHYQHQLDKLADPQANIRGETEQDLKAIIQECQADEIAHKEHARAHGGEEAPFYPALSTVIKGISRTAIWLSTRI